MVDPIVIDRVERYLSELVFRNVELKVKMVDRTLVFGAETINDDYFAIYTTPEGEVIKITKM